MIVMHGRATLFVFYKRQKIYCFPLLPFNLFDSASLFLIRLNQAKFIIKQNKYELNEIIQRYLFQKFS